MAAQLQEVELEQQALTWPEKARSIKVVDQQTYNQAATVLIDIATLKKQIVEHHKPIKDSAFAAHKAAVAAEKRLLDPLEEASGIIKRGIGVFEQEQERIRLEAQRKAEEEASRLEEEARLKLAVQAEEMGATEETITEIVNTPIPLQRPVVAPSFQRTTGVSTSRKPVYKWRVIDEKKIPREFLMIDPVKVNGIVRAMGSATNIAGIQVYEDLPNISVRARA